MSRDLEKKKQKSHGPGGTLSLQVFVDSSEAAGEFAGSLLARACCDVQGGVTKKSSPVTLHPSDCSIKESHNLLSPPARQKLARSRQKLPEEAVIPS